MGSAPDLLTSSRTGTFNFAFGSNLSPTQVRGRLQSSPTSSVPVAVARLDNWKWIICQRGYANIVELPPGHSDSNQAPDQDPDLRTVWGVIYNLSPEDEATLDRYEGHDEGRNPRPEPNPDTRPGARERKPYLQGGWDYNKQYLPVTVTRWLQDPAQYGIEKGAEQIVVLAYVDEQRVEEGERIIPEYVGRMNRGIDEAVALGVPRAWADQVMRREGWVRPGEYPPDQYFGTDEGYVAEIEVGTEAS